MDSIKKFVSKLDYEDGSLHRNIMKIAKNRDLGTAIIAMMAYAGTKPKVMNKWPFNLGKSF